MNEQTVRAITREGKRGTERDLILNQRDPESIAATGKNKVPKQKPLMPGTSHCLQPCAPPLSGKPVRPSARIDGVRMAHSLIIPLFASVKGGRDNIPAEERMRDVYWARMTKLRGHLLGHWAPVDLMMTYKQRRDLHSCS